MEVGYKIQLLELWDSKLLAFKENNNREVIFNVDGVKVETYEKESKKTYTVIFANQEGSLQIVTINNDLFTFTYNDPIQVFSKECVNCVEETTKQIIAKIVNWL